VLRSDEIRKRQHGSAPEQRLPPEAYSDAANQAVMSALARDAALAASAQHCVIADATFMDPAHRQAIQQAAGRAGVPFVGLWLEVPAAELERRVAARDGDASDATVAVLRAAMRDDPGAGAWHPIDAARADTALDLARAAVRAHIVLN
jgi:predicted kinase